ncbi:sensor histidine kinase [Leucobacter viscericola]|uniref:histidine kinase n=1 Tax=Leucobacter viscericola TaxID=2714935 RepID=A0A6G7XFI4_9MICO|nr:sensor histidine kinase [Leucobacter viscericola]QIK63157.1 sensor histidine kinase [Leucobacter viscericola]
MSNTVHDPTRGEASGGNGRRWPTRWWDLGVVVGLLAMSMPGAIGAIDWGNTGSIGGVSLPTLSIVMLLGFALLYVALGRAALRRTTLQHFAPPLPRDIVFLSLWILLLGAATAINSSFASLQFLAYPMVWSILDEYWQAFLASIVLSALVAVGSAISFLQREVPNALWIAGAIGAISFVFSVAMGTWITRIYDRGEEQRQLAEKLQATQHEVAVLSKEAGVSAERERLSRELHDTLTQTLTGLVMLSEQAERALAAGNTELVQDRLSRVHSAALESLTEARALVATTQPLGDGGLEAAIERVVARLRADTGLKVSCSIEPLALDREQQVVLLRAVQEGLANARKHARASSVRVTLSSDHGAEAASRNFDAPAAEGGSRADLPCVAVLRVEDDGLGPGGAATEASGFGLTGLGDRLRAAGGEVSFGASERGGAVLEVRLPFAGVAAGSGVADGGGSQ